MLSLWILVTFYVLSRFFTLIDSISHMLTVKQMCLLLVFNLFNFQILNIHVCNVSAVS